MNKYSIGAFFISIGLLYSLFAWNKFFNLTLGKLIEYDFIKTPKINPKDLLTSGRKNQIIAYGLSLIGIGIYIIFFSKL